MQQQLSSENGGLSPEQLQNLTPEQEQAIVGYGEAAHALKESRAFHTVCNSVINEAFLDWGESQPKEREKREGLYNEVRGIRSIQAALDRAISQAIAVQEQQAMRNDPDAKQRQNMQDRDEESFGLNFDEFGHQKQ